MALEFDRDSGTFVQTLLDFSGGLNTRDLDSVIRDDELSSIRNFTYDTYGALKIRKGFGKVYQTSIGSNPIKSMGGYYKTGSDRETIATSTTHIYKYVSATQSYSSIKDSLTTGLKFGMHQFMDHYYMGNGDDDIQIYNGTTVWDSGYTIPATGVTAAEGAAGVLANETYQYKVTYYYADGESNSNATATSIKPTVNHKVNLSAIPTGGTGTVSRKLYRTEGDDVTFKLLTTINDNTTTVYVDNIPDSGLGADLDIDNFSVAACQYIVNHKSRLWCAGDSDNPSRVYYSKTLHPESFPVTNYWDIGLDDGDEITGITVNLGALVIFKKYSTWVITGDVPTGTTADMILENVNPTIGCVSYWTQVHAGNDLLFLTPDLGVHRLHRIILAATETMDTEAISNKIDPTIKALNKSYLVDAHARSYNHKYYLFVADGTAVLPDICLVLDLRKMNPEDESTIAWTIYDNYDFSCSAWIIDDDGEHLYTGSSTAGYSYEVETGTNDDGTNIECDAATKYFEMGSFLHEKIIRLLGVHGRASEDYEFTIRIFTLWKNEEFQDTFSFSGGGVVTDDEVLYDTSEYDKLLFDVDGGFTSTVLDILRTKYPTRPANKIKLKIEDVSANQEFRFMGFELSGFIGLGRPIQ